MSNFNKFMRASAASYRRSARAANQSAREAAKKYREQKKKEDIADAAAAVKEYTEYITVLKSVHKEAADPVNWEEILDDVPPTAPEKTSTNEDAAKRKLATYKPSAIDKLFGLAGSKKRKLEKAVATGRANDEQQYKAAVTKSEEDARELEFLQATGKGILNKDIHAYKAAIDYYEPFSEIAELGSKLDMEFREDNGTIDLRVNGLDIIPDYVLSQTSTGKLSRKNMPVGKFQELYQDYVCSAVLRVAREVLAVIPLNYVVVNASGSLFDSATGHEGEHTLVSVVITPEKLASLNYATLDPSDSMKNFHHHMKFAKTGGFSPVEKINAQALIF
ncbi:MAG: hypothetical protein ABW007_13070 [Chitinophagaceae bacterium]